MIIVVVIGGLFNLAMALFHVLAWKWLGLQRDLRFAMPMTRVLAQILNACVCYYLCVMGYICLAYGQELLSTPLGRVVLSSLALFWLGRTVAQIVYFGWRTRKLLSWVLLFALGATLFVVPSVWAWQ